MDKDELKISDIGRTSRAIAFLTVIMMFCVVAFSFIMAWKLKSALIMITLIPSASGAYVIVERACFRRSEAVDVVKLQKANSENFTPEQITALVDVINRNKLDSDSKGESSEFDTGFTDGFMTDTTNIDDTGGVE
jgi:hypothetical protein